METLPEIIGLAGTNGAGKDTLGDLRYETQGARKVSLSDILRHEADKRELSHTRENLSSISREWGSLMGAGALSLMTLRNFTETRTETESGISIVSIRRPAEAEAIQEAGGVILWVDADRRLRYQRILHANRGRVDDMVSYEVFCEQEDREMVPASDDPAALNMAGVRDRADIHLINEFASEEKYRRYLSTRFGLKRSR